MNKLLSEETKRLAGIIPRHHGGLPFAIVAQPAMTSQHSVDESKQRLLDERRITLFKDARGMSQALERAYGLVQRVNATLQSSRMKYAGGSMQEKSRADLYRLDQEMQSSLESLQALKSAVEDLEAGAKVAAREARHRTRQGR